MIIETTKRGSITQKTAELVCENTGDVQKKRLKYVFYFTLMETKSRQIVKSELHCKYAFKQFVRGS